GLRVWKIDKDLTPLGWSASPKPSPDGGYNQNNGIGVNPADGSHLYSMDTCENRVQRFRVSDATSGSTLTCTSRLNCPAFEIQFGHRGTASANTDNLGY